MQLHVMSQHSMQPVIRCPLCQDVLSNKIHLQLHLTHLHSVAPDCVEKLIMTVSRSNDYKDFCVCVYVCVSAKNVFLQICKFF